MKLNSLEYLTYYIAHQLHFTIDVVDAMKLKEFNNWLRYFKIQNTGKEDTKPSNETDDLLTFLRGKKNG